MKKLTQKSIELVIEGYNKEKNILSERLGLLLTNNKTISTRSSIQRRLNEIDEAILKALNELE